MYKRQFGMQRSSAKSRGIDWQFTYEQWLAWWGEDISKRGLAADQLVMARHGDTGPYHPDNVKKLSGPDNTREACLGVKKSEDFCLGQSLARIGVKRGPYKKHN